MISLSSVHPTEVIPNQRQSILGAALMMWIRNAASRGNPAKVSASRAQSSPQRFDLGAEIGQLGFDLGLPFILQRRGPGGEADG